MAETDLSYKVLMSADTVDGVWTYCMELCGSLQAYGVEVHLVTMGAPMSDWQKEEAASLPNLRLYETNFLLEWMQNPWQDIKESGEWLLHLEEKINFDLVHLNCFAYGCLPFRSPKVMVAHSDVYSWFRAVKREDPPAEWGRYYRCVKEGMFNANTVIAPSQAMLRFIQTIYGLNGDCRVIYNGRRKNLFQPAGKKELSVLSMGRLWDEAKNIRLLSDAAPRIKAPVRLAGDDSFADNRFCPQKNLSFLGKLSTTEVAAQLATTAIFVLPARYEPFGLTALEAALSGCALVLGDIPSLREIWQENAIYVDTDNADRLADTVNQLITDENLLATYQKKAFLHAQHFSSEAMGREYMDVYRQLLQQKNVRKTRNPIE